MLFKNSQDDYKMSIDSSITRIGLKISGGADSALVAYMLAKYSEAERPDLKIYPIKYGTKMANETKTCNTPIRLH